MNVKARELQWNLGLPASHHLTFANPGVEQGKVKELGPA